MHNLKQFILSNIYMYLYTCVHAHTISQINYQLKNTFFGFFFLVFTIALLQIRLTALQSCLLRESRRRGGVSSMPEIEIKSFTTNYSGILSVYH